MSWEMWSGGRPTPTTRKSQSGRAGTPVARSRRFRAGVRRREERVAVIAASCGKQAFGTGAGALTPRKCLEQARLIITRTRSAASASIRSRRPEAANARRANRAQPPRTTLRNPHEAIASDAGEWIEGRPAVVAATPIRGGGEQQQDDTSGANFVAFDTTWWAAFGYCADVRGRSTSAGRPTESQCNALARTAVRAARIQHCADPSGSLLSGGCREGLADAREIPARTATGCAGARHRLCDEYPGSSLQDWADEV